MSIARNPRFDPHAGDIIHDGHTTREVTVVEDFIYGDILATIVVTKVTPAQGNDIWASTLRDWRTWARYTRVQRYAEDMT